MSAQVRSQTAKLRQYYARHWNVPLECVHVEYDENGRGEEFGRVWADGFPVWTTL